MGQSLNPYLSHYKIAFASSGFLYPLLYRLTLRLAFPHRENIGLTQLIFKEMRNREGGVLIPEGSAVSLLAAFSNSPPLTPFGHSV